MSSKHNSGAFSAPPTLLHMLRVQADRQSDQLVFAFLVDGEQEEVRLTYSELDRRARAIGAVLQSRSSAVDQRALLLFPPGLDFIAAFFGCIYAGITAVPAYPPRLNRPSPRIQSIVADAQPSLVLTTGKIIKSLKKRFDYVPDLAALHWLNLEEVGDDLAGEWHEPTITVDTLAVLQYTSGSTGTPKGVMLSHANILQNLEVIRRGFQIDCNDVGAFWLPNFHDMGLIGGILEPIFVGASSIFMAPAAFLQRPGRWLEMISRYRATISGGPNFAYQMCVDKITPQQREGLDLSSWEIAYCGAEPIRHHTLEAFADTFEPHGFRNRAYYACYGLAESTLLVTGGDGTVEPIVTSFQTAALAQGQARTAEDTEKDATALVSCGHARPGHCVIIANPDTLTACTHGEIGEIWAAGPSVAQGYWQQPEASERTFQAVLTDSDDGPFLRTGDLGFLHEGELYVSGRLKDLIIIHGRNHYPHDIEYTVSESHDALEASMGAAFSIEENGEEKLVVVNEMTRRHRKTAIEEILPGVRGAVAHEHQIQLHALTLIRPLSMPRTSSGKIKRHACKEMFLDGTLKVLGEWRNNEEQETGNKATPHSALPIPYSALRDWLVRYLSELLKMEPGEIDVQRPLVDFGLDSVQTVELVAQLETLLGRSLEPALVWDYPTIEALAGHLAKNKEQDAQRQPGIENEETPHSALQTPNSKEPIAVVGIGCRFPGADGPEAFWQHLHDGRDMIGETPRDRWPVDVYYESGPEPAPGKMNTRWGGFLQQVDRFDAAFFGIAPREAARMDPQQRLLLEVAWEALEHAGIDPSGLAGSQTGVFVGISSYDYSRLQFSHPDLIDAYAGTGNAHSIAANRISYFLDLRGPSMAIDTACSSSLMAAHMAIGSLRRGEVEMALAGGVNLILSPELTITFSQARMMAADGRCKTFDAAADGYVRGEGCGMLVLKRLSDAERDGDPILAVLQGSAVNQDGRSNGLTAPNGLAQQAVIRSALADAGVEAAEIHVVEAHGTGTRLGDPIEIHALQAVFDEQKDDNPLVVGSVKTNVGHLESAAGVAGLIKTVLALMHEEIPPHLHLRTINPYIALDNSRLVIDGRAHSWSRTDKPRLAGVSSFGFGGTNVHVIVGESPLRDMELGAQNAQLDPQLLMLSAKNEKALGELALRYADLLETDPALNLADICYTAAAGRAQFAHRLAVVAETAEDLRQQFRQGIDVHPFPTTQTSISAAFLFTGQGAQYARMGQRLYETEPVFRAALEHCAAILEEVQEQLLDYPEKWSLLEVLFAAEQGSLIDFTLYAQPALFAIEYALAQLWRSWGIEPAVVIGHSVGEYVAACVAGIVSLEDGLRLVAARGRLMDRLPAHVGSMAVVFAPEATVQTVIKPFKEQVAIAALNGPENVVISGTLSGLSAAVEALVAEGVETRPLTVSHAFHSPLMEPILDEFETLAGKCDFRTPRIPFVSNLTGELLSQAPDARYWRDHIRRPVRFADGLAAVVASGAAVCLEIGPQPHLISMAGRILPDVAFGAGLASMRKGQDERRVILNSLGQLFVRGFEPDLYLEGPSQNGSQLYKAHLPTYPFQRKRFWLKTNLTAQFGTPSSQPAHSYPAVEPLRLATAVPLFESWLDFEAAEDKRKLLRDNVVAVARLYWGAGEHEIAGFQDTADAPDQQGSPFKTQTVLNPGDDGTAAFETFAYDELHNSWVLLAGGEVRRSDSLDAADSDLMQSKYSGRASESSHSPEYVTRETLLLASPEKRKGLIRTYMENALASVLGLGREDIRRMRADRALDTMGLDSLMALETKNRVEMELGVDLPVVKLLQGPTIDELVDYLATFQFGKEFVPRLSPVTLSEVGQPAALSYGQQAMWVLQQLMPANLSFNVAGAARLSGLLDAPALEAALEQLVERHGALRTVFSVNEKGKFSGRPQQTVRAKMIAPLSQIDATTWDDDAVEAFLREEAYRPFDLEHGPLLRLVLLKREEQEHVLLLAINHLVTDFWSISLLVRDLYWLYQRETGNWERGKAAQGQNSATHTPEGHYSPQSAIQMADYVRWQAEILDSEEGAAHRDYWMQQLSGDLPRLDLSTDRPRRSVQTYEGNSVSRHFSPALTEHLKTLSQEQGVTLATTLAAAFQTLLFRYTGQEDLLIGSVIAGREHPALQELVGYLVNPVALRADFSGDPSFVEFLAQTKQTLLQAIAHQDYPLPRLVEEMVVNGSIKIEPSRPPLFETMFIMQRAQAMNEQGLAAFALGVPGARLELDGLTVESRPLGGLPAQFDLTLMVAEMDGGLTAAFHYNIYLFEASSVTRMLAHLETLLEAIVVNPERPVDEISLLTTAEKNQQLVNWNRTQTEYPRDKTVHQLLSDQVRRTPDRTAVAFENESWSYAELEQRAGSVATYLRQQGIRPGSLVGLFVERSLDMVAALLGILKAGAAYIPLDPDFPAERIRLMLEDANPAAVITQEQLAERLTVTGFNLLCLDGKQETENQDKALECHDGPCSALPEDLAYVIYTSGSTGRPKGVQITHRAAVNFLTSMQRKPGLDEDDRLLAVTTLSFDIAVLELFLPLISGAQVVIASRDVAMDGTQLQRLMIEADITVMQATPASWRLLLEAGWPGKEDLTVLCGGETLPPDLAEKLLSRCRALWNMYGPTETTVWSTISRISSAAEPVSIGRPIANTQVYLLDDKQQPVPMGVVGQLYIGGDGVARGYLNKPELSDERFVADPFVVEDNGQTKVSSFTDKPKMYKTGDLARFLPDGTLLHLGRNDFQVKVRGYRVELAEIEAAVARHPAVADNVIVARERSPGDKRLISYWVPVTQQETVPQAEMRAFLRPYLPQYMIPDQFVALESLPKTPNGKIDRRSLPEPPDVRGASQTEYVKPRDDLERRLAAICAEVLELDRVGIFDNFFDLGGNSFSAARLVFQVREQYQVQLSLRQLFQEPTVAGLSQEIKIASRRRDALIGGNGHENIGGSLFEAMTLGQMRAEVNSLISEFEFQAIEPSAVSDTGIEPHSTFPTPRSILLTGATGFLGAYLLRDLLRNTEATVICLVRAKSAAAAFLRIKSNLAAYDLWDEVFADRIEPLPGDLGSPLLGLREARFMELAERVDVIYHNAAQVNFVYSYNEHKASNVLGTGEILRLVSSGQAQGSAPTPLHFISTLSVFHSGQHGNGTRFMENENLDGIGVPFGGYAQSKWVGEKLIMAAMAHGVPATIFRPGLISGDSRRGTWNTANMMSTMVLACAASGAAPDLDISVDIVPVDYVSRAIVTLAGRPQSWGQAYHLSNPQPASYGDLLLWMEQAGLSLQILPFERWRARMVTLATQLGHDYWNPFLPLLDEVSADQLFMPPIDCRNTVVGLAIAAEETGDAAVHCPPVDAQLLQTYLDFFRRQGLLSTGQTAW